MKLIFFMLKINGIMNYANDILSIMNIYYLLDIYSVILLSFYKDKMYECIIH